ncbi:MAG: glycosyltransferase family 39 protein [Clostridia bacterium]|nr:glycosyltransferase family 39 protein [Clostridia bacterium]
MLQLRKKLFSILALGSLALLLYTFALSTFVRSKQLLKIPSFLTLLYTIFFMGIILAFYYLFLKDKLRIRPAHFIIGLCVLTFVPRFLWIVLVDTKPVSDFAFYNDYAINITKGLFKSYDKTCLVFPHRFGYPFILSLIYKLFGINLFAGKIFNIFLSVCTSILIYWIGARSFNEKTGRISSLLYAIWPSQIMYSSVLASEHSFIVFFTLSIALFIMAQYKFKGKMSIILPASAGISLALSQFVRPVASLLFAVFVICIFILNRYKQPLSKSIFNKVKLLGFILIGYVLSVALLNYTVSSLTGVSIWRSSSGYNLLVGTNSKSSGTYNNEDAHILSEYNWDFKKVHSAAKQKALERIKSNPLEFIYLIEDKFIIMWGDEAYGPLWSTVDFNSETPSSKWFDQHIHLLLIISQAYYIAILIFAFIGCAVIYKKRRYKAAAFLLIFLAHIGAYTFFEVQSRYHFPAILYMLIIAAYGINCGFSTVIQTKTRAA